MLKGVAWGPGLPTAPGGSILNSTEHGRHGKLQRVRDGVGDAPGPTPPFTYSSSPFYCFIKCAFREVSDQVPSLHNQHTENQSLTITFQSTVDP